MSIYGRTRKKLNMRLGSWYRVEVHQGPSKDSKARQNVETPNEFIILQRLLTVDVNGKSLMSKEINEVTGIVRLFTSPNKGMQPAKGIIRAVTIIANEEYG